MARKMQCELATRVFNSESRECLKLIRMTSIGNSKVGASDPDVDPPSVANMSPPQSRIVLTPLPRCSPIS